MTGWQDERPAHGIVLMNGYIVLCSCGSELELPAEDRSLSQSIRYDLLLDRHAKHKARREKK